ncbi:unnamed protein product [marine sediment metagenome]|uniref:Uncharacterized protein n=1 Tax=marine sediment metagenome TaxID=412755 RepID=X1LF21_9ZZZZ
MVGSIGVSYGLEEARREFWEAWNGLSQVHTQKELEAQSKKMWAARKRLLKVDPEFRAMIKARKDKANAEAEEHSRQTQAKHKAIISEAEVAAAKMKARMPEDIDEWVQKHRIKVMTPEEAETKSKSKLICPICHDPDRGNTLNGKPACFECMHVTVPEEELKNYNREYRRRWNRSRKKH